MRKKIKGIRSQNTDNKKFKDQLENYHTSQNDMIERYMKQNLVPEKSLVRRPMSPQSQSQLRMDKVVSNVIMNILRKQKEEKDSVVKDPMEEKKMKFPPLDVLHKHTLAKIGDLEMFEMALCKAKDV